MESHHVRRAGRNVDHADPGQLGDLPWSGGAGRRCAGDRAEVLDLRAVGQALLQLPQPVLLPPLPLAPAAAAAGSLQPPRPGVPERAEHILGRPKAAPAGGVSAIAVPG